MIYLKSLRRKLGVVTLLMACVLTAGWIRSRTTYDDLWLQSGSKTVDIFYSSPVGIGLFRSEHLLPRYKSSYPVGHFAIQTQPAKRLNGQLYPIN